MVPGVLVELRFGEAAIMIRVFAMCATANGLDVVENVLGRMPLSGVIGLSPRRPTDAISGLVHAGAFCQARGLEFIEVDGYALDGDVDRRRLLDLSVDLVLVPGWQRLLPEWFITHCRMGAIGVHGSAAGITAGRGRSPQNWALIMGKKVFEVSLFFIDPVVDSGDILNTRSIPLTDDDDIRASYSKLGRCAADMMVESWHRGDIRARRATPQSGMVRYLPQRRPEDGAIDWRRSNRQVHDFVCALSRPYPGAFSRLGDATVTLWRGRPVGADGEEEGRPGEVLAVGRDGALLVATGDGAYRAEEWSVEPRRSIETGITLESVSFARQMERIIARHRAKHPDQPLARDIEVLARWSPESAEGWS
jgi:UDP-4-amino-4-deoxy-L-arabinose formyltransferase/UDP-glucuronic acid dehydrogenase (UDP-4-keto-hexauronic acid decarboxylating)